MMARRLVVACVGIAVALGASVATAGAATPGAPVGNVTPSTQAVAGVAVVAQSAPVDGAVALLVRNGSAKPVRIDRVTVAATSADGGSATSAGTTAAYPQVLAPGELGLAQVKFRAKSPPAPGGTFTTKVRSTPVSAARAARALDVSGTTLSPPQAGAVAQTLSATVGNATKRWTARTPSAAVVCFGEASTPSTFSSAKVPARTLAPGRSASVTVPLTSLCPTYLVAARAT